MCFSFLSPTPNHPLQKEELIAIVWPLAQENSLADHWLINLLWWICASSVPVEILDIYFSLLLSYSISILSLSIPLFIFFLSTCLFAYVIFFFLSSPEIQTFPMKTQKSCRATQVFSYSKWRRLIRTNRIPELLWVWVTTVLASRERVHRKWLLQKCKLFSILPRELRNITLDKWVAIFFVVFLCFVFS